MTRDRVTCWTLTCDACGDGWQGEAPHLPTKAAAAEFAASAGWLLREEAVCPECRSTRACAEAGHRWGNWAHAGPFPSGRGGTWLGRVRHCMICTAADWDPAVAVARGQA